MCDLNLSLTRMGQLLWGAGEKAMGRGLKVSSRSGKSRSARKQPRSGGVRVAEPSKDQSRVAQLEEALDVANGFIEASPIAMWCIEYSEPVDTYSAEQEIVRQVFENDCHWRMCNHAMARLYNLPDGLDFNRQRVSSYFPRSAENEAFIRQLIDANFHLDSAPAVDVRHDGTPMHVENSVRCRIEAGLLLRMWGTVSDITESRLAHDRLVHREQSVNAILSALPDAVLVVDPTGNVVAVNSAFELDFGWPAKDVLGKQVSPIVDLSAGSVRGSRPAGQFPQRWRAPVRHANGLSVDCDIRMAPLQEDEGLRRSVLSIRPTAVQRPGGRETAAREGSRTRAVNRFYPARLFRTIVAISTPNNSAALRLLPACAIAFLIIRASNLRTASLRELAGSVAFASWFDGATMSFDIESRSALSRRVCSTSVSRTVFSQTAARCSTMLRNSRTFPGKA